MHVGGLTAKGQDERTRNLGTTELACLSACRPGARLSVQHQSTRKDPNHGGRTQKRKNGDHQWASTARPKLGVCQGWRKGVEHSGKARGKLKANRKVSGNILNDLPPAVMRCVDGTLLWAPTFGSEKKTKPFLHLSLGKAGPFTLENNSCVKAFKCKFAK